MMYVGARLLRRPGSAYRRQLGFAMIFAQLPLQRITSPFFHMNDEWVASAELFGATRGIYWGTLVVIWAICLPPLAIASRAIENRRRWLWFGFYLVLFPYLLVGPFFLGLEYLMVSRGVLDQTYLGIGLLFLISEGVTIVLYLLTRRYLDAAWERPSRATGPVAARP